MRGEAGTDRGWGAEYETGRKGKERRQRGGGERAREGARAKEGEKEDRRVGPWAQGQPPSFACRWGMEKAPCLPVQLPRVTQDLPRPFPRSYSKAPQHSHDQVLLR